MIKKSFFLGISEFSSILIWISINVTNNNFFWNCFKWKIFQKLKTKINRLPQMITILSIQIFCSKWINSSIQSIQCSIFRKWCFWKIWPISCWLYFVLKIEHHSNLFSSNLCSKIIFVLFSWNSWWYSSSLKQKSPKMMEKWSKIIKNKWNKIIGEISWEWCDEKWWRHCSIFRKFHYWNIRMNLRCWGIVLKIEHQQMTCTNENSSIVIGKIMKLSKMKKLEKKTSNFNNK